MDPAIVLVLGLGLDADNGKEREQTAQEECDKAGHCAASVSRVQTRGGRRVERLEELT